MHPPPPLFTPPPRPLPSSLRALPPSLRPTFGTLAHGVNRLAERMAVVWRIVAALDARRQLEGLLRLRQDLHHLSATAPLSSLRADLLLEVLFRSDRRCALGVQRRAALLQLLLWCYPRVRDGFVTEM
jgi:hypothetical protein